MLLLLMMMMISNVTPVLKAALGIITSELEGYRNMHLRMGIYKNLRCVWGGGGGRGIHCLQRTSRHSLN